MKIYNVTDPEFTNYGRIIEGYEEEKKAIVEALKNNTLIEAGLRCSSTLFKKESVHPLSMISSTMMTFCPTIGWLTSFKILTSPLETVPPP